MFIQVMLGGGRRNFWPEDVPDLEYPTRDGERDDLRDLTQVRRFLIEIKQYAITFRNARIVFNSIYKNNWILLFQYNIFSLIE